MKYSLHKKRSFPFISSVNVTNPQHFWAVVVLEKSTTSFTKHFNEYTFPNFSPHLISRKLNFPVDNMISIVDSSKTFYCFENLVG